jgi:hypothetical protein
MLPGAASLGQSDGADAAAGAARAQKTLAFLGNPQRIPSRGDRFGRLTVSSPAGSTGRGTSGAASGATASAA